MDDLVDLDGLYYKKFTDVPFTGDVTGNGQGSISDGKRNGPWVWCYDNKSQSYGVELSSYPPFFQQG